MNKWRRAITCLCGIAMAYFLTVSCSNVDSDVDAKWQLREFVSADGSSVKSDSIFYNFQKGSFSMIYLSRNGMYETFFGNYTLKDDKISIILLPESQENEYYKAHIGWENASRIFRIESLNSSSLRLEHGGVRYLFRKYG